MNDKQKSHSIVRKVFVPITILTIIQIITLIVIVYFSGIISTTKQNAFNVIDARNKNRASFIEREMVSRWSNLDIFEKKINEILNNEIEKNNIDIEQLETNSEYYSDFLYNVSDVVIEAIRLNSVTGGFVVLNNSNLDELTDKSFQKPGIYIRDYDPSANNAGDNGDLLLLRSPVNTSSRLSIAMDKNWKPMFDFSSDNKFYNCLYKPYETALKYSGYSATTLGYWSKGYCLNADSTDAISFSIPLIYSDGTVYGVFGIEISIPYFEELIPSDELLGNGGAAYILAIYNEEDDEYINVCTTGSAKKYIKNGHSIKVSTSENKHESFSYIVDENDNKYICSVQDISNYMSNSPYMNDNWKLLAIAESKELFYLSDFIFIITCLMIAILCVVSILGVAISCYLIANPIISLADDVKSADRNKKVSLNKTYINELDGLAVEIENLSNEMVEYYNKFTNIMEMSNRKIGAFEIDIFKGRFFITDNFFEIFDDYDIKVHELDINSFYEELEKYDKYLVFKIDDINTDNVYCIPHKDRFIWVSLKTSNKDNKKIGLIEDVSSEMLERQKLEKERDQDFLTELLNRRAFYRRIDRLFEFEREKIKTAVFIMFDLDSLKYVNDTYGHVYGDMYIKGMADGLKETLPETSIISRLSGDEFIAIVYGYDSKDELRNIIRNMRNSFNNRAIELNSGQKYSIQFSAGISWYPDDGRDYKSLLKYADFAMYKVKNSSKGKIGEFDKEIYNKESFLLSCKEELNEMLENEEVDYYFQPIVDAKTAKILGYEALMRASVPNLNSPDKILLVAQNEFKMDRIEYVTFNLSMEKFTRLIKEGKIDKNAKLFINSLPNYSLSEEEFDYFEGKYSDYLKNIVLEITEQQRMNDYIINYKKSKVKNWNAELALDDFGSGFNNHISLLKTKPDYIKIDLSIIDGIDKDLNKQNVVESIVEYGHEQNMKFIAEGIENYEVLKKVIELNVDYVQGYYCGKPASEVYELDEKIVSEILDLSK